MHNIIQETAWQISREESIEDPRSQVRLLDPEDVYHVLNYDKGDEAIRSIVINLSKIKELQLNPQNLVNLRVLILHSSTRLKELPNFSKATNLRGIDLRFCVGLTSVHSSVFSLRNLEKLNLGGCISLRSLRSNVHLDSLRYLSLYGCMTLKDFSVTSKNMVKLNLELTSIKQLPSSFGLQSNLQKLRLAYTYIDHLPPSMKHLTRLRHLDLRHCRKLRTLPELPPSLETLDARGCVSLETVMFPSTACEQLMENKKRVAFWNCLKLDEQSLTAIELNAQINMMKFAHQHFSRLGDAQSTYVYPGSKVPEWLVHKTTHDDYVIIDLSSVLSHNSSQLRAFGISMINTSDFHNFVQKVKFGDSIPNVPILLRFFCTFGILVLIGTYNIYVRRLV
ncbi:hypothetical protein ACSQ67_021562 [Phaseolus vulgaris]